MNALEIVAFAVAAVICLLPGILAWNHYFGGTKHAAEKKVTLRHTKPAVEKAF